MQQRQQTGGRGKGTLFLVVSIVAAVLAAALVVRLLQQAQSKIDLAQQAAETVDVVIATRALYVGLPITEEDVIVRAFPPDMVPMESIYSQLNEILGATPQARILPNELVRRERIADAERGVGLNAIIDTGKRAMAVFVNAEEAVAGFLEPGHWVDVIVTIRPDETGNDEPRAIAKTIMQKIKILAVGAQLGDGSTDVEQRAASSSGRRNRPTVTLEVSPDEAEQIALASAQGEIHLALRADIDIEQIDTKGATASVLVGRPPKAASTRSSGRSRPAARTVPLAVEEDKERAQVIQGGTTTTVTFEKDGTTVEETDGRRRR